MFTVDFGSPKPLVYRDPSIYEDLGIRFLGVISAADESDELKRRLKTAAAEETARLISEFSGSLTYDRLIGRIPSLGIGLSAALTESFGFKCGAAIQNISLSDSSRELMEEKRGKKEDDRDSQWTVEGFMGDHAIETEEELERLFSPGCVPPGVLTIPELLPQVTSPDVIYMGGGRLKAPKFCPSCGEKQHRRANSCPECGEDLRPYMK